MTVIGKKQELMRERQLAGLFLDRPEMVIDLPAWMLAKDWIETFGAMPWKLASGSDNPGRFCLASP